MSFIITKYNHITCKASKAVYKASKTACKASKAVCKASKAVCKAVIQKLNTHYMDTDSFILSIKTKDLIKDLEYFKDDLNSVNWIKTINNTI